MPNHIVGLDIGSHSIKAIIGELKKDGKLELIDILKYPSAGLMRGVVHDISDMTQALSEPLNQIKNISKSAISNIYLGIGSNDMKVHPSIGVVAVSRADYEIYEDDIKRAKQSAQAINIPPNRMVMHSIVKEFVVDGVRDIRDPLGMIGNRLEVNSIIIDAFIPSVKNISKCVEMLGGGLKDLIISPLAGARATLNKNQKELGVVLVDIGFGKTSICVYEENKLLHTHILPVGSRDITNDLAIGLKIPVEVAETIKFSFGSALPKEISARETVDLTRIDAKLKGSISKKFIAGIIEARLAEIFELVDNELKSIGVSMKLPSGVVLAGGGSKIPGIVDLARQELKLSAQICLPNPTPLYSRTDGHSEQLEDPEFIVALGLILWGYDRTVEKKQINVPLKGMLKKIFGYFNP